MSNRIQCDKCKLTMKPDFHITTISVFFKVGEDWWNEGYNLCDECTNKLLKWMKEND